MDVFLCTWSNGKDTCLDFTCTNTLHSALVAGCAMDGAHMVKHAHDLKTRKYAEKC